MTATHVAIHEYNATTRSIIIPAGVSTSLGLWDACVDALSSYKSQQIANQSIAKPGHWSSPATNIGNRAVSEKWKSAYLGQPHVHAGSDKRAVIGCSVTKATPTAATYQFMKIYIGEFG